MKISESKVWMKFYDEKEWGILLPECTAYSYLRVNNSHKAHLTAIHYYGRNISYSELFRMIDEAADAFYAAGVRCGDVVSFLSVATPETIASLYALNKLGAAVNTIDPRMDTRSISRMIRSSGSKLLLAVDVAFSKVYDVMEEIAVDKIIVVSPASSLGFVKKFLYRKSIHMMKIPYGDKVVSWKDFLRDGESVSAEEAPYVGDAPVAITYTGGTTGFPKGVVLTNDSMNAVVINFMYSGLAHRDGDRFLGIIPIFSSYGMVCGLHMPLCLSMELVPIPRFIPDTIGKLVRDFRPQHIISTPAFYEILMQSREVKGLDLSFITTFGSGGDTMNAGLEEKLIKFMKEHKIKNPLVQGYGMSELSAAVSFCITEMHKPGSVGVPSLTTTVSIFDVETGEELDYNCEGEICVTGPSMMKCYFNEPEETASVMRLHDDGKVWIHSGDIGYIDDDGFLFVKGRIKRMITRFDGHKVFPVNLEAEISSRRDVRNCAVIGVRDIGHAQGCYPLAIVEFKEGTDTDAACREIYFDCLKTVESRGTPVAVIAAEKIPLTGMGKNDCLTLESQYGDFDYIKWQEGV